MEPDKNSQYNFQLPPSNGPPDEPDQDEAAVAFARAKINSIFGGADAPPPAPATQNPEPASPQVYQPAQLYQAEARLQDKIEPAAHHSTPDHQLPSGPAAPVTPTPVFENLNFPGTYAPSPPVAPVAAIPSRQDMIANFAETRKQPQPAGKTGHILRPLIKATLISALVFMVYNAPIVMGQVYYYITPANAEPTPIILSEGGAVPVGADPRIIISKLNIDAPVVYDETSYDEARVQEALQRGIVHYGTTALPGELGNAVYLGHSSNSPWDPGRYKTVFSILRRLEINDTFVMHYEGKRYIYEVFAKNVIEPSDLSVLNQQVTEPIVTLITCDPPGVNWRRLAIQARQISPEPTKAQPTTTNPDSLQQDGALPGSPPSLYDRIRDWIF